MKKVTIVGGGSSAHVVAPLLANSGFEITILTSRPNKWNKDLSLEFQYENGKVEKIIEGRIKEATNNDKVAIGNADIILLCMPVSQYYNAISRIGKYINRDKEVWVGSIYGQGGINWMFEEIKKEYTLDKLVYFSYGLIPWICRTKEYGSVGITYGAKQRNVAAISPKDKFDEVNEKLLKNICPKWFGIGETYQADNFISLTLSVDNQIIHIARMYGLYLKNKEGWKTLKEVPYFYRDFDKGSAEILKKLDLDYDKIRQKIKELHKNINFEYMLNYLDLERFSYNSSNENIKESFVNSKTLGQIETPVMKEGDSFILDKNSRFFTDDIFYGIAIAKWLATKYNLEVPMIDELLEWSQSYLELKLLENGILNMECEYKGIKVCTPEKYLTYSEEELTK